MPTEIITQILRHFPLIFSCLPTRRKRSHRGEGSTSDVLLERELDITYTLLARIVEAIGRLIKIVVVRNQNVLVLLMLHCSCNSGAAAFFAVSGPFSARFRVQGNGEGVALAGPTPVR